MVKLSLVIVAYNMARELPRTLLSAVAPYQLGNNLPELEILIVDNGSVPPYSIDNIPAGIPGQTALRILNFPPGNPSPVAAINEAARRASGDWIGIMIDGARILSPGILHGVAEAARKFPNPFVHTLSAHLGPEIQQVSTLNGYNQDTEDRLLAELAWEEDGYRLFTASVPAPSSRFGWNGPMAESNAFFLPTAEYHRLGGMDAAFTGAGGGLANLDFFRRAMDDAALQPILLNGEATFHQVHGGITTNHVPDIPRDQLVKSFFREYESLREQAFRMSERASLLVGSQNPLCSGFASKFCVRPA